MIVYYVLLDREGLPSEIVWMGASMDDMDRFLESDECPDMIEGVQDISTGEWDI